MKATQCTHICGNDDINLPVVLLSTVMTICSISDAIKTHKNGVVYHCAIKYCNTIQARTHILNS